MILASFVVVRCEVEVEPECEARAGQALKSQLEPVLKNFTARRDDSKCKHHKKDRAIYFSNFVLARKKVKKMLFSTDDV